MADHRWPILLGIVVAALLSFRTKLIDVFTYLSPRENYAFGGSVRDPATGNSRSSIDKVPLDLVTGAPRDFSPIFRFSYEHQTR